MTNAELIREARERADDRPGSPTPQLLTRLADALGRVTAEVARLHDLHLERTKFTTTQIDRATAAESALTESRAECARLRADKEVLLQTILIAHRQLDELGGAPNSALAAHDTPEGE